MTGLQMLRLLKKNGFQVTGIKGSHHDMTDGIHKTTVPVHGKKELNPKTQEKILRQAGLK
jgi:predicted RNA binding protein YcfA (HicA-like mRNA interferase family)